MKIDFHFMKNQLEISLCGELDEHSASFVRVRLDNLLEEFQQKGILDVVFDFSQVSFMDSTGIGVLLGRYKKFGKYMELSLKNPTSHIDKIFYMTGIYKIMPKVS